MEEKKKKYEINEESLKDVAGGNRSRPEKETLFCPICNADRVFVENDWRDGRTCSKCGHEIKY